jgi:hypothetical protein
MGTEIMVHTCNGVLLSHKEEWNPAIWCKMNGTRGHCVKWNQADRENQISYVVSSCGSKQKSGLKVKSWLLGTRKSADGGGEVRWRKWLMDVINTHSIVHMKISQWMPLVCALEFISKSGKKSSMCFHKIAPRIKWNSSHMLVWCHECCTQERFWHRCV